MKVQFGLVMAILTFVSTSIATESPFVQLTYLAPEDVRAQSVGSNVELSADPQVLGEAQSLRLSLTEYEEAKKSLQVAKQYNSLVVFSLTPIRTSHCIRTKTKKSDYNDKSC